MLENMDFLTLDFESYYDKDFSLKKVSNLEYIRDPRFEVHGAALKFNDEHAVWLDQREVTNTFSRIDWANTAVISHNSLFDLGVLHDHFGIAPAWRIDTLGLCRALLCHDIPFDLDTICPLLGGPKKLDGGDPLKEVKGYRFAECSDEVITRLGRYAERDADMARHVFDKLWPELPTHEREFMDLILRLSVQGIFRLDHTAAQDARREVSEDHNAKIAASGLDPSTLRSQPKFIEALRAHGIEPPTKVSYTKTNPQGVTTWATSKQDPEFVALQADERVAHLINARFAAMSNNAITRIDRLISITGLAPYTLPVQLKYYGAHTGRLAGAGSINMQNLNARGVGAGLRSAITVPPGCVLVIKDLSGIELRMNMWFSGQYDVLETIRQGGDVYIEQAAQQFKIQPWVRDKSDPVTEKMRDYGKVVELGCGYQMGAPKFKANAATGPMGTDPRYLTDAEAYETINTYRRSRPWVKRSWDWLQNVALPRMTDKHANEQRGPVTFKHEAIELPGGMTIKMPNLEPSEDGWTWGMNGVTHRAYGGIMQENIIQSLTGRLINQSMLDIDRELAGTDFTHAITHDAVRATEKAINARGAVVHQVHDEIIAVCKEQDADDVAALMDEVMTTTPDWAPGLPLDVEGGASYVYGK